MREPRLLSGRFFRHQNPETTKWEPWCFEDLPPDARERVMEGLEVDQLRSICDDLSAAIQRTMVRVGREAIEDNIGLLDPVVREAIDLDSIRHSYDDLGTHSLRLQAQKLSNVLVVLGDTFELARVP